MDELADEAEQEERVDDALFDSVESHHTTLPEHLNVPAQLDARVSNALFNAIKNPLRKGLLDTACNKRSFAKTGSRIAQSRLASVAAGNCNVFVRETIQRAPTASVSLVVDASGSMDHGLGPNLMIIANNAALAFAKAIDSLKGCDSEVVYFGIYNQGEHQDTYTAKAFGRRAVSERFQVESYGSTPLHRGVNVSANSLVQQAKDKQVMIVITDGTSNDYSASIEAVERATKMGINVIGIAINMTSIDGIEDSNVISVTSETDIPKALDTAVKRGLFS